MHSTDISELSCLGKLKQNTNQNQSIQPYASPHFPNDYKTTSLKRNALAEVSHKVCNWEDTSL